MFTHRTAAHPDAGRGYSPIIAVLQDPVPGAGPEDAVNGEKLTRSWVFISESGSTTRLVPRRPTASSSALRVSHGFTPA
jgi:hypothetical protein